MHDMVVIPLLCFLFPCRDADKTSLRVAVVLAKVAQLELLQACPALSLWVKPKHQR